MLFAAYKQYGFMIYLDLMQLKFGYSIYLYSKENFYNVLHSFHKMEECRQIFLEIQSDRTLQIHKNPLDVGRILLYASVFRCWKRKKYLTIKRYLQAQNAYFYRINRVLL